MTTTPNRRPCGDQEAVTVLVVGAGPTGLTLACELARRGVSFRLVDAAPGPQPGSRGKGLQPRTLEVLDDLGVGEMIRTLGRFAMPLRVVGPDGRATHGGTVPGALRDRPDIPYPASLTIPQWRVEDALRWRLADLGGAVEFGATVIGLEQSDRAVVATVTTDIETETVDAAWLVGCDGGHSSVRRRSGIPFDGETREAVRMIVADVEVDGLDRGAWHMWRHDEGPVALCPLPSTDSFQYQAGVAHGVDVSRATMQTILERRTGRTDIRLRDPRWSSLWRANVRLADRYRRGRVFLAGDAAHVHSPAGGQGMNTGIQDAYNLGWKLAAVARGARPALLDSYEAERRPVAAAVLALSDERLRQTIEHRALPTRREADTTQLGVTYRGSALVGDDRDSRDDATPVRGGDRAPDATGLLTLDGGHRLFELIGGGTFTLIDFGASATVGTSGPGCRVLRVVERATDPGDVVDTRGHLARVYDATAQTLVLIRPDGYISRISDVGDLSTVSHHLAVTLGLDRMRADTGVRR